MVGRVAVASAIMCVLSWVGFLQPAFGPTLFRDPQPSTARVVEVIGPSPCRLVLAYEANGEPVQARSYSGVWPYCDYTVGESLDIVYSQSDPTKWRGVGFTYELTVPAMVIGGILLVGSVVILVNWRKPYRRPRMITL